MSWFKRDKSQPVIPPVEPISSGKPSPAGTPLGYRSQSSTYVASRDGANYDSPPSNQPYGSQSQSRNRGNYGVTGGVSDPYARGERDLAADRNALFAGSAEIKEGQRGPTFMDEHTGQQSQDFGDNEEEEVEAIKAQTKSLKQESVASTRNALRIAREAEETGRATLLRLGEQSEKIANTERHLDVSKGLAIRAEDNTDELKKLNRSIFRPAITFNKQAKRDKQELQRELRLREEMTEREVAMQDIRESQNRVGRAATYGHTGSGENDEESIGSYRRQKTSVEQNLRKEQRKVYQFEATESDDELEDEIDDNLDELTDATKRMKALGLAMGSELQTQNNRLARLSDKTDKLGMRVDTNTARLNRIGR
ncbi:hypothetical protein M0805_004267 [Coniferiporia weirii]|nr:hypothetical protein M0805_004267 [Coniferiporia weirii]